MTYISALLETTTCLALVESSSKLFQTGHNPPQTPICLDSNLSVVEGCQALAEHKISSAPVYDAKQGGFIGMLDFKDLVAYVLEVFHKVPVEHSHAFEEQMEVTDIVKRAVGNKNDVPVALVSNLSQRNPLVAIDQNAPVKNALLEFQKGGVQRVVVVGSKGESQNRFVGVLSQSTVAAFIASKLGKLANPRPEPGLWPNGDRTIEELGLVKGTGSVVSITQDETVIEALAVMHKNHVSSVAIVDRSPGYQQLLGSISMSDMKEVFSKRGGYKHLYENCFKFFAQIRSTQGLENGGDDRVPSFVIHPTTTVIAALERMSSTHSHRMWIIEGNDRLVGVLSLSDFVKVMV